MSCAVYIPPNFEQDLLAERRPQIVAFYNEQYFMPGNITLAIWYLARPEPLLVQGEGRAPDRHRGRVTGRLAKLAVSRGQDVAAGLPPKRLRGPHSSSMRAAAAAIHHLSVEPRGSIVVAGTAAIRRYLAVHPRSSEGPLYHPVLTFIRGRTRVRCGA